MKIEPVYDYQGGSTKVEIYKVVDDNNMMLYMGSHDDCDIFIKTGFRMTRVGCDQINNQINSWQLCPVCLGQFMYGSQCSICKGEKIISTLSGLPPSEHIKNYEIEGKIRGEDLQKPIPPLTEIITEG